MSPCTTPVSYTHLDVYKRQDIHGEYEAFQHVLKNASGAVKRKVNEIFGNTLREAEKKELCTLIYYPEEKLQLVKAREKDLDDWYLITLDVYKRQEYIFERFYESLIESYQSERSVKFYADQLCLTPKHLSGVVKEVRGKTVGEWIDAVSYTHLDVYKRQV